MRFFLTMAASLVACSSPTTPPASETDGGADAIMDGAAADSSVDDGAETSDTTTTTDTWESWAKGFFATYCVECHGATSTTRKYTTLADVKRDAAKIKCGTASIKLAGCGSFPPPKQFPISNTTKTNPKPTDDERARLIAWFDAGAP